MSDYANSPAFSVLRPSTRRLLAYIAALVERNNNNPTTIWHDELETVGSRSVIGPGLRELTALGFITRTLDIKRSTFALADQWQSLSKRDALLTSATARLPPTHRKWKKPAAPNHAQA